MSYQSTLLDKLAERQMPENKQVYYGRFIMDDAIKKHIKRGAAVAILHTVATCCSILIETKIKSSSI